MATVRSLTSRSGHGYGQESDQPVWLSVSLQENTLQVVYADQAAAFDPFSAIETPNANPATPVEGRKVGGLGRLLVRELAGHHAYRRDGERNVTVLEFTSTPKDALALQSWLPPAATGETPALPAG